MADGKWVVVYFLHRRDNMRLSDPMDVVQARNYMLDVQALTGCLSAFMFRESVVQAARPEPKREVMQSHKGDKRCICSDGREDERDVCETCDSDIEDRT